MSGQWAALVAGCAVMAFVIKALGPVVFGGRPLPERLRAVVFLVAAPLLAALVVTQAMAEGDELKLDAETAGVAVGRGRRLVPRALDRLPAAGRRCDRRPARAGLSQSG